MDKIYKVFFSSTFEDLREERSEVQKALLKLSCLPVGMELFPAADDETWEFIKTQIEDSDYYVVLIAGSYGSIGPGGVSFTEMEFDYASEIRKPTIGFVHGNRGKIPLEKSETDRARVQKLEALVAKIRSRPVRHFTTPQELALEVTTSFVDLKARRPAIGYVRADAIVDFKKYAELLESNRDLERRLNELASSTNCKIASWLDEVGEFCVIFSVRTSINDNLALSKKWREIAQMLSSYIASNQEEHILFGALADGLVKQGDVFDERRDFGYDLTQSTKDTVRTKFVLQGFVNIVTEQRLVPSLRGRNQDRTYTTQVWKLTDTGRSQLLLLMEGH